VRGGGGAPVGILLADDHPVVRRGLRQVLDAEPDLHVVDEAADGYEAVRRGVKDDVDLAILDISMPRMTGLQAARELSRLRPDLHILILSMHDSAQHLAEALDAGSCGYVLKSVADHDLVRACRAAMRGEAVLPPSAGQAILERSMRHADAAAHLTPREAQILALIADGHTGPDIAEMLVISPRTVERHRENLLTKLGLRNRIELTRYAIRTGLIEP
jgi:DNA-binding NarL/FixJ family response regulator